MSTLGGLAQYCSSSEDEIEEQPHEVTREADTQRLQVKTEGSLFQSLKNVDKPSIVKLKSELLKPPFSDSDDSDLDSEDQDSDSGGDGDNTSNADHRTAGTGIKLFLPPPDFDNENVGDSGIRHQYREHCGCKSCEQTRWRRIHHNESLELNVAKRKMQEKEEQERKKRQRIRNNLRKRGIRKDPTALSKVQKVTGVFF